MRFRYTEKQPREATSEGEKLGAAQVEKLLATLLDELRDTAILLDDRRCLEVVEKTDHVEGELGARVRRMVNTFQYQELLAGLNPLAGSGSE